MNEISRIQPINLVAQCLDITPRRIRQFIENGDIPRLGRGQVCLTWAMYFYAGSLAVEGWAHKPTDAKTLYAIAWLTGLGTKPSSKDIEACAATFVRNGFTRDDALRAIGQAEGLRGYE
ncbi:MAG: hypothetical protein ABTQ25_02055 [Nitrosomonas ureae]